MEKIGHGEFLYFKNKQKADLSILGWDFGRNSTVDKACLVL